MIGPSRLRTPRRSVRSIRPAGGGRRRRSVDAVDTSQVELPISAAGVRRIASKGFPLRETLAAMQLRNRRITLGYSSLSEQLASLIAGSDGRRDANWCTFSTWSSKTIGNWIAADAVPEPLRNLRRVPAFVVGWLTAFCRWLAQRSNGASYRCLAAGNRFVFLEVGLVVARFVESFRDVDRGELDGRAEELWAAYWEEMEATLADLSQLDPSWLLTDAPSSQDLRLGLRQYFEALFETDRKARAELVLAGNTLVGAYEQRRVDGYVSAALALFTNRAMRNLVRQRTGTLNGRLWRWPSAVFAWLMTRGLVLNTPDEQLCVGRSLPRRPGLADAPIFPADLETIENPLLQALLTRYDLSCDDPRRRRVRNWTSYDQRMSYITNLFRSRQHCKSLLDAHPFPPDVVAALLAGRLPPDGESASASASDTVEPGAVTQVVAQELVN
jgi:hypothetical protein